MLTRSSLETQKLELMSTVSEARLRQAALERENLELRNARPSPGPPMIPNGAARRHSPSPSPSPAASMLHHRDNTPRVITFNSFYSLNIHEPSYIFFKF